MKMTCKAYIATCASSWNASTGAERTRNQYGTPSSISSFDRCQQTYQAKRHALRSNRRYGKERARSNERCHTSIPPNLLSMTLESDPNFKPLLAYLSCSLCYFTGLDPRQATQLMCSVGAPQCELAHQPLHSGLRAVLCVEHVLGMSSSCRELFEEMVRCLSDSECVRSHPDPTRALSDCARRDAAGVPDTCRGTIEAYATCRRAQIDPARRIMGNPAARVKHE